MARIPTDGGDLGAWGAILNSFLQVLHAGDGYILNGTAALPGLTFSDGTTTDTDTGIWHPSADVIAISTGGVERVRFTNTGQTLTGTLVGTYTLGGTPTLGANLTTADDVWLGFGAAAGRIVFDSTPATDVVAIMDADIGIGTAGPSYKLDVQGTIRATSDISITGGSRALSVPDGSLVFLVGDVTRVRVENTTGNVKFAGSATRATTEGTNHLDIFNGTAPVGTLANGVSLYSTAGEAGLMDAAGHSIVFKAHTANALVATVLGSVGPTGANTTVQEWLTISLDGNTRYIPCF